MPAASLTSAYRIAAGREDRTVPQEAIAEHAAWFHGLERQAAPCYRDYLARAVARAHRGELSAPELGAIAFAMPSLLIGVVTVTSFDCAFAGGTFDARPLPDRAVLAAAHAAQWLAWSWQEADAVAVPA